MPIPLRAFSSPTHSPPTGTRKSSARCAHFSKGQNPRASARRRTTARTTTTPQRASRSGALHRHQVRATRAALALAFDLGTPWTRRRDGGIARRVAGTDASQFFVRAGCPVEKPRNPSAHFAGAARKAGTRGLLLFGYFLLKEKVTRPLASGRNARRAGEHPGDIAQPKTEATGSRPAPG